MITIQFVHAIKTIVHAIPSEWIYMYLGIDYSSQPMQTCLSRCSRLKGQFVLHILLNKAALVVKTNFWLTD